MFRVNIQPYIPAQKNKLQMVIPYTLNQMHEYQKSCTKLDYQIEDISKTSQNLSNDVIKFNNVKIPSLNNNITELITEVSYISNMTNTLEKQIKNKPEINVTDDIQEISKLEFIFAHFKKVTTTAAHLNFDLYHLHEKQLNNIRNKIFEITRLLRKEFMNSTINNNIEEKNKIFELRIIHRKLKLSYDKILRFKAANDFGKVKEMLQSMGNYGIKLVKIIKHLKQIDTDLAAYKDESTI